MARGRRNWRGGLVAIAAMMALACQPKVKGDEMAKGLDWLATDSAPKDYPAYVVDAIFALEDGSVEGVPDDRLSNAGWGEPGSVQIIGDDEKAAPRQLNVKWYDLVSRKGYAGAFPLQADRMDSVLRQRFPQPDGNRTAADYLRVGFAPGGDVAVWVSSQRVNHLVGMFKAAPAQIELSEMSHDPALSLDQFVHRMLDAALPDGKAQQIVAAPVPEGLWHHLDKRYTWQVSVIGQFTGDLLWVEYANGEADWFDLSGKREPRTSSMTEVRAIPELLEFGWSGPTGRKFQARVEFDQAEVMAAFERFAAESPGQPIVIEAEPQDQGREVGVYLRSGQKFYRFTKVRSGVWDG